MITIGIVEDNRQIADNLESIIQTFDGFNVLFIANNGLELLNKLTTHQPQLLIMDIQMPEMDGIAAVKAVKSSYPNIKIIMHSVLNNDNAIIESIMLGANGYILKNEKPQKLIEAINEVMEGGAPLTPSVAQKLVKYMQGLNAQPQPKIQYNLSERETEIIELIAQGLSYKLIADRLFISVKTVGKHIENIYTKLHVTNKVDAINVFKGFSTP
jgi:DNA-binding NarL/FixJ family response regulator